MSHLQNLMFSKYHWTQKEAKTWMSKHNFKPIKPVDITEHYYRYRLRIPLKNFNYRIITIDHDRPIKSVIMFKYHGSAEGYL